MTCPNCNTSLPEGAKCCGKCGATLVPASPPKPAVPAKKICPVCGFENDPDMNFCLMDGTKLAGALPEAMPRPAKAKQAKPADPGQTLRTERLSREVFLGWLKKADAAAYHALLGSSEKETAAAAALVLVNDNTRTLQAIAAPISAATLQAMLASGRAKQRALQVLFPLFFCLLMIMSLFSCAFTACAQGVEAGTVSVLFGSAVTIPPMFITRMKLGRQSVVNVLAFLEQEIAERQKGA